MRATASLMRREFSAYFLSPIAYVVLAVFLAVTGHLFYLTLMQLTATGPKGVEFPMQFMLGDEKFWLGTRWLDHSDRAWDARDQDPDAYPRTTLPMLALVKAVSGNGMRS